MASGAARMGFGLLLAFGAAAPASRAQSPPNIVVVMADDLDVPTLDAAVAAGFMPNYVQHVLSPGMQFTRAFVVQSSCCPSRATLLTGQYPHNHGVEGNYPPIGGCGAFDDASSLATWLRGAGYRTGLVGKYMNGYGDDPLGTGCHRPTYVPPGWDDWQALCDPTTYQVYDYDISDNGAVVRYGQGPADYQTDVLASRTVDFVIESEAVDAAPFFLMVTPLAPHQERLQVVPGCPTNLGVLAGIRAAPRHEGSAATLAMPRSPSFSEADVSDKPQWIQRLGPIDPAGEACIESVFRDRIESLRAVDDLLATLLGALDATGERARTVLVFVSDNGYLLGDHRLTHKTHVYDMSLRIPLAIVLPQPVSGMNDEVVTNVDLAPTLLDLAGVAPGVAPDGRSLGPILAGGDAAWRRRFLVEHHQEVAMIDGPSYVAIRATARSPFTPEHLLAAYATGELEHYDGVSDPHQLQSLHADTSAARVAERRELERLRLGLSGCADGTCQGLEFRDPREGIAAGAGAAAAVPNRARLFDGAGVPRLDVAPYGPAGWGVDVAAGNVDAAGHAELLTAPGPGPTLGPQIRAFRTDGTAVPKVNFYAYGTLRHGARVSSRNLDADTPAEILTGAGAGAVLGPHVRGFSDVAAGPVAPLPRISFYAFATLRYGCRADGGDASGDGIDEMLTSPGPGPTFAAQVRGFEDSGTAVRPIPGLSFVAFATPGFGAEVAGGDLVAGGPDDILVTPGPGGTPAFPAEVRGFGYAAAHVTMLPGCAAVALSGSLRGARVSAADLDVDGREEAIVAAGPDPGRPTTVVVLRYDGASLQPTGPGFDAFPGAAHGATLAGGYFGL